MAILEPSRSLFAVTLVVQNMGESAKKDSHSPRRGRAGAEAKGGNHRGIQMLAGGSGLGSVGCDVSGVGWALGRKRQGAGAVQGAAGIRK